VGHAEDLKIRRMTNESRGFYALLGPYLARRSIAKELGGMTWDDDGLEWFVATRGTQLLGFCALRQSNGKAELRSSYVLPKHRRAGVYRLLFLARLAAIRRPARARSVVHAEAVPTFLANGFSEMRRTKNFHVMEADLS
jgi:GNAT superfamily N-acetyltransferase